LTNLENWKLWLNNLKNGDSSYNNFEKRIADILRNLPAGSFCLIFFKDLFLLLLTIFFRLLLSLIIASFPILLVLTNALESSCIRHAKETGQTEDLTKALHEIYNKLGW
jgi:hypothetical protein